MARTQKGLTTGQVRNIVAALPHDDLALLAMALRTTAASMDEMDARYPDPDRRADAERLRTIAQAFSDANQARDFILDGK
jgi:hypothetical protein